MIPEQFITLLLNIQRILALLRLLLTNRMAIMVTRPAEAGVVSEMEMLVVAGVIMVTTSRVIKSMDITIPTTSPKLPLWGRRRSERLTLWA